MRPLLLSALLLVPAASSAAGAKKPALVDASANFKVSFVMRLGGITRSGAFLINDGAQANYLDASTKGGKREAAVIANCVVVEAPATAAAVPSARAECQFELSTPESKDPGTTLQLQTAFMAELGKPLTLLEGKDRRLEVTVTKL